MGDVQLTGFGHFDDFVVRDDGHRVAIGIETNAFVRYIVDHNRIQRLCGEFLPSALQDILGFRRESDDELRCFLAREFGKDINRRLEIESERALRLIFCAACNLGL